MLGIIAKKLWLSRRAPGFLVWFCKGFMALFLYLVFLVYFLLVYLFELWLACCSPCSPYRP